MIHSKPQPSMAGLFRKHRSVILSVGLLLIGTFAFGGFGKAPASAQRSFDAGLDAHLAGNLDLAKKEYLKVLKVDPGNKFANFNLGLIAQQANQKNEADKRYRRALVTDKYFLPAMFNLAVLKTSKGENEGAETLYREIIKRHPTRAEPYLYLGILLSQRMDRQAEGTELVKKAVAMDPQLRTRLGEGFETLIPKASSGPEGKKS